MWFNKNEDENVVWDTITRPTMDTLTRIISNFVNTHTQDQWLFLDLHE